ncbi:hypothetical protein IL38_12785 [Actinopolyspora erythraea]|uniref:NAD(P)/FAD-dependent oxidoreductase n=1 Tax=Actinopolyspora erythraea TaxID=414996 RepID=A0ABR4X383_9ACTN|nr:FAD-dependent oxidoreductase [Actinopolyspora erythraea]KGI81131.1 hypothetical protein IL38_12785 [Actinopolyspora erythraea]
MRRVVIAGRGPVAHRLAHELARHPVEVVVLGADRRRPAPNRVLLPGVLAGTLPVETVAMPPLPERVRTGARAVSVDREHRVVRTESGECVDYDDLVLATGTSSPVVPGDSALSLSTVDECVRLRERIDAGGRVVVSGGGVLGVRLAQTLARGGVGVDLVAAAGLLPGRVDPACAEVLARALDPSIRLRAGARIAEHRAGRVRLVDGTTIQATALVAPDGRPDGGLAVDAGLHVAECGGVVVDSELRTSDPRIRAVGGCTADPGSAEHAWDRADLLAALLSGQRPRRGGGPRTRLRAPGLDLLAVGDEPGEDEVVLSDPSSGRYARFVLRDGRIASAVLLGFPHATGVVNQCFDDGRELPGDLRALLFGPSAPDELSPSALPDDALVCRCNSVSKRVITSAWREGARSPEELSASTRAGTGCGTCASALTELCTWLNSEEAA